MTFGSLFAGIGGIDLALERVGMTCSWQVEKDDYARRVLEKHWPDVPRYEDVRYFLGGKRWRANRDAWQVDLVCGGFPCQDISLAGKGAGITGSRSGLWSEYARIVRLLRPSYVLVENVPALTVRGLDRVLGDLADLGYDAEWDRIPAAAVGAPHLRWRIFILAYAPGVLRPAAKWGEPDGTSESLAADADRNGRKPRRPDHAEERTEGRESDRVPVGSDVPNTDRRRRRTRKRKDDAGKSHAQGGGKQVLEHPASRWSGPGWRKQFSAYCEEQRNLYWPDAEPPVCGVADGVPAFLGRSGGRIDAHESCLSKASTAGVPTGAAVPEMRIDGQSAEASQGSPRCTLCRVPLSDVPHHRRSKVWEVGTWKKETKGVFGVRRGVHELFAYESENLRSGVLVGSWETQCVETVANRVDALRCLGNAVVPGVVEWIGRRLIASSRPAAGGGMGG